MNLQDSAQEHEAQIWAINNRPREVVTFAPGEHGYGPVECENCGEDMPTVRRAYGFKVCTACAQIAEQVSARRRR